MPEGHICGSLMYNLFGQMPWTEKNIGPKYKNVCLGLLLFSLICSFLQIEKIHIGQDILIPTKVRNSTRGVRLEARLVARREKVLARRAHFLEWVRLGPFSAEA